MSDLGAITETNLGGNIHVVGLSVGLFVGSFVGMADVGGLVGTTGLTQDLLVVLHSNPEQQSLLVIPGPFGKPQAVVTEFSVAQDGRPRRFRLPPPHPHSERFPPMTQRCALSSEQ